MIVNTLLATGLAMWCWSQLWSYMVHREPWDCRCVLVLDDIEGRLCNLEDERSARLEESSDPEYLGPPHCTKCSAAG
jgi:hypothetical protein